VTLLLATSQWTVTSVDVGSEAGRVHRRCGVRPAARSGDRPGELLNQRPAGVRGVAELPGVTLRAHQRRLVPPGSLVGDHVLIGHVVRLAVETAGDRDRVPPLSHSNHPAPARQTLALDHRQACPPRRATVDTRIDHDLTRAQRAALRITPGSVASG
jgi:hypothetical protein